MLIGLDCAAPHLVFERYRDRMPHVTALCERGTFGPMRSTIPPITVPAWLSMVTGYDPGELGVYGFRNRRAGSYALDLVTADQVHQPRLWDRLSERGRSVSVLFVPPTYPAAPVRGQQVSCFMTPDLQGVWCYPPALARELTEAFGPYQMDVEGFRQRPPADILADIQRMTRQHFAIARHLWQTRSPEFMMLVEMGPDRLHHAFYRHMDSAHPRHDPRHAFVNAGPDYYALLDQEIGQLIALADDDTTIMLVSDHGARVMYGGICINQWLIDRGDLVLRTPVTQPTPFAQLDIDWSRTRAWGEGGYYARVFLNVAGREPHGVVTRADYAAERERLAAALRELPCPSNGPQVAHRVLAPEETYSRVNGLAPDLCAFFGDLAYRSIGSVGHGSWYVDDNDTGEDSCNHDWNGIFAIAGAGVTARGAIEGCSIYDVAPTVLDLFNMTPPDDWTGTTQAARSTAHWIER
jgi:predicted AlkP superfamily phosphohydrolase/phosphomutase